MSDHSFPRPALKAQPWRCFGALSVKPAGLTPPVPIGSDSLMPEQTWGGSVAPPVARNWTPDGGAERWTEPPPPTSVTLPWPFPAVVVRLRSTPSCTNGRWVSAGSSSRLRAQTETLRTRNWRRCSKRWDAASGGSGRTTRSEWQRWEAWRARTPLACRGLSARTGRPPSRLRSQTHPPVSSLSCLSCVSPALDWPRPGQARVVSRPRPYPSPPPALTPRPPCATMPPLPGQRHLHFP